MKRATGHVSLSEIVVPKDRQEKSLLKNNSSDIWLKIDLGTLDGN
jgi:hypothetical protein